MIRLLFVFILALEIVQPARGLTRVYSVGNSFSDHLAGTPTVALSLGEQLDWGRHMIPGASLPYIWANPTGGFQTQGYYPSALPNKAWDFVLLQPWGGTVASNGQAAADFAGLAWQGNPDAAILFLATSSFSLLPTANPGDFHAAFLGGDAANTGSKAFFEALVTGLRGTSPGKPVGLIPLQHVLAELDRRLALGELVPEMTSIRDVLDETNHFNARGRYLACLTAFSTFFRRSAGGALSGTFDASYSVSPAFAAYAQEVVWQVVQAEPYAVYAVGGGRPTARFSHGKLRGPAPWAAGFDGSASSDDDGIIAVWNWQFFDGAQAATASGPVVSRTFPEGVHRVVLTVTDNDGLTASRTAWVQSRGGTGGPIALEAEFGQVGGNWSVVNDPNASMGAALTPAPGFNNTSNSTPPSGVDDRVQMHVRVPAAGSYTIRARVNAPTTSDDSFWVRVNGGSWFVWNNIGNNTSAYLWSQLPGTYPLPAGDVTLEFAYREDGTVLDKVRLSLTGSAPAGFGEAAVNGNYDEEPPTIPQNVQASNVHVQGLTLSWLLSTDNVGVVGYRVFRDGQLFAVVGEPPVSVTGLSPATEYAFAVQAADAEGNLSPLSDPVTVRTPPNHPPTAHIAALSLKGPAPLTVTFQGGGSSDPDPGDIVIGYAWDFGDGNTAGSFNEVSHTFADPGVYEVRLTVTDLFGLSDTGTATVVVTGDQLLSRWRQLHFGTAESAGAADDFADPDGDGVGNFLEYAMGGNPTSALGAPAARLDTSTVPPRFTFPAPRSEVTYVIEESGGLGGWTSVFETRGAPGREVRYPFHPPATGRVFLRLKAYLTR